MLKITFLTAALGVAAVSLVAARPSLPNADGDSEKSSLLKVSTENATRLVVHVPLGDVRLIADGSSQMTVHAVRSYRGSLDGAARRWMDSSFLTASIQNGTLAVRDHPFGNDGLKDGRGNSEGRHNLKDLKLVVEIHVPRNLAAALNVTSGNVALSGGYRSMAASVVAGTLTEDGIRCGGATTLHLEAGRLSALLSARAGGPTNLQVEAGQVLLTLPKGSDAEVSATVSVGNIAGLPGGSEPKEVGQLGETRRGRLGHGRSKVSVQVASGEVRVKAAEPFQALKPELGDNRGDEKEMNGQFGRELAEAMSEVEEETKSIDLDLKFDGREIHGRLGRDLSAAIRREMQKVKPEIDRALHEADRAVKEATKASDL